MYAPFETGLQAPSAEVYAYEMPGGQYTNLFQQAKALGLASRWAEVCKAYADVNLLFGDIVKVTPSSKVVGDMALFLVANNLTPRGHARPRARAGLPRERRRALRGAARPAARRVPEGLQERILKGRPAHHRASRREPAAGRPRGRPAEGRRLARRPGDRSRRAEPICSTPASSPTSPRTIRSYSDTSILPTPMFFFGPDPDAENLVEIEPGKTLIVKLLAVGEPHADGKRTVFFELNGQPREVVVADRSLASSVTRGPEGRPRRPEPDRLAPARPGRRRRRRTPATRSARGRSSSRSRP